MNDDQVDVFNFTSNDSLEDETERNIDILLETNGLLERVGIAVKKIASIGELSRVASSMFVAIFESLFHIRIDGIIRNPQNMDEYAQNAQYVINELSIQIQMDLAHISGVAIAQGDIRAVSNLVHIFARIVSITTLETISHGDAFLSNGTDSISTHESTFQPSNSSPEIERRSSPESFERRRIPFTAPSRAHSLDRFDKETRKLVRQSLLAMTLEEKLELARKRREAVKQNRSAALSSLSARQSATSYRAQQSRWVEDTKRETLAQRVRRDSEDHTMLRRVYKGLLRKMQEWKLDELKEKKEKVEATKREAHWHIETLKNMYEDRLRLLKDFKASASKDDDVLLRAHRKMHSELKKFTIKNQSKRLSSYKSLLAQAREQKLAKRRESHHDFLSFLAAEDWENSLRASY